MTGAGLQVVAEQVAELAQQQRVDARVQAVAAMVYAQPRHLERTRQPADRVGPLDDCDVVSGARRMPRRDQPGRAGPHDEDHL